jgi:hypothetical protein
VSDPWYERNSVLWGAGTVVAFVLVLVQPFVTAAWPSQVASLLGMYGVRFALLLAAGAAMGAGGYALGRRSRPQHLASESFALDTAQGPPALPEGPPVPPAMRRFLSLTVAEQNVLTDLWEAPNHQIMLSGLADVRGLHGIPAHTWNAVVYSLRDIRSLVMDVHSYESYTSDGLALTYDGRMLMAQVTLTQEPEA